MLVELSKCAHKATKLSTCIISKQICLMQTGPKHSLVQNKAL